MKMVLKTIYEFLNEKIIVLSNKFLSQKAWNIFINSIWSSIVTKQFLFINSFYMIFYSIS